MNRRFSVHEINQQRTAFGEYHTLFSTLKKYPDKFYNYMRMQPSTFSYILDKCYIYLQKDWCNFHQQPIEPEERLVVTFRFLATGQTYTELATSFRMGNSTVGTIVKETMVVLWNVLQPVHMPVPSEEMFEEIANDFYIQWNLPHTCGAMDCRHMRVHKQAHCGSEYFNYKQFDSIKLQAVVDAFYKFIFIEIGDIGRNHDATTYEISKLNAALINGCIKLPKQRKLPNSSVILPYFFIADGAYALKECIMKPYAGKNLPIEQQKFNQRLSRPRMVVECAFGQLCRKWRIFFKMMQYDPETVKLITKSCCLLQNIIIDLEEKNNCFTKRKLDDYTDDIPVEDIFVEDERECYDVSGYGKEVRYELTKYVMKHPILFPTDINRKIKRK